MDFRNVCVLFEDVKRANGFNEKAKLLREYFDKCRENQLGDQIFSLIRLLLPKLDRERQSYNMKESKIARVLIKTLALPNNNDKKVLNKSYLMAGQASDFGDVAYSVIRKYLSNNKTILKINELNASLDDIVTRSNEGEAEDILMKLFKKCSPEDSRWIIRIILKELKLGIDANRILNCYHMDAANYYTFNNSLRKVCEVLYDKNVNLHELDINIFEAFRPMLSKRVDAASFKKDFQDNKLFYVENKFDGERFQLHMENHIFKYFSRNGFDFTSSYGSTYDEGILTPKIKDCFEPFVQKIILDGEMMLYNKYTTKFGSKGMSLDVKKLKESGRYQPCFCIYDIILLNDKILTNRPLKDRASILERVLKKDITSSSIRVSEIKKVYSRQAIIDELNLSVDNEEEGIIVKDPESVYRYSDRNSGWFKMKLEYFQDTMNDLDLIVMGGQFASSTSDQLNSFIVGVRSGNTEEGKPIYLSFGKVSSGLNDDELDMLNKRLKDEKRLFNNGHSGSLVFGKEVPNYYIEPENSVVFVVRATELIRTNDVSYKTSYTLRFPRVLKVRDDKPVEECLSMNELLELSNKNKSVIKLNKRNIELEEILQTKTRQVKKKKVVVPTFADTKQISDLLAGYTFYVLNGTGQKTKDDIEALTKKAGGKIFYKADDTVDIVLVGEYNNKAKELSSKRKRFDVVSIDWLNRVIQDGNLLGYETTEIFCLGNNIKNCLSDEVDRYGDSYTEDATIESLKHCFQIMKNLNEEPSFSGLINITNVKSFDHFTAYFDKYSTINDASTDVIYFSLPDELEFRYYSGTVCTSIIPETNLIVFNGDDARKTILKDYLKTINRFDIEIKTSHFIYEKI